MDTPSSSTSTQTTVDCGEPSGRDVVTTPTNGFSRNARSAAVSSLHEMATIRSIAPRARSAMSSGTVTSNFQSRSESRSFGSVIIFM